MLVNGMRFDTHFRMTLSRGGKASSSMNPMFNVFGCVLLIVPEWKPVSVGPIIINQPYSADFFLEGRQCCHL